MKSPLIVGGAWVATVVIAYLLGAGGREDGVQDRGTRPEGAGAAPSATRESASAASAQPAAERGAAAPAPTRDSVAAEAADDEPYTLEGVDTLEELSRRFMRFAAKKLAEGPEGQKELFRELDRLMQDRELRPLFRDQAAASRLLYPWLKFAMDHDTEIVALTETLYRTAAEEPAWFEGLDDDSFELFTEGVAILLPGYVDAERLDRFRGYAEAIMAAPKESLPRALQSNQRRVGKALEFWTPPVAPERALQMLLDPTVPIASKLGLLRRIDPADLQGTDVAAILAAGLERGNSDAFAFIQRYNRNARDLATLDHGFLEGVAAGRLSSGYVQYYLNVTGRGAWADARPFVEQGLRRGGEATDAFAGALAYLRDVPREFVDEVRAGYTLSEQALKLLQARFPDR